MSKKFEPGTLGKELFKAVESTQGYLFISDSTENVSDEMAVAIAERSLLETYRNADNIEKFLKRAKKVLKRSRKEKKDVKG